MGNPSRIIKMRKFFPYILILILLVGLFSPIMSVQAQEAETEAPQGECRDLELGEALPGSFSQEECVDKGWGWEWKAFATPQGECKDLELWEALPGSFSQEECEDKGSRYQWTEFSKIGTTTNDSTSDSTALEKFLDKSCRINPFSQGCILKITYLFFHGIASFFLWVSAIFFNSVILIALDSGMYAKSFISEAWVIVRDMSNIFFILILLYIAFQTILGLGGHNGPKKMVAQVIIMALLINFSMFFTKVVIDSSNILALVFYNRLNVETVSSSGQPRDYTPMVNSKEKDISGGLVKDFDPTQLLSEEFFIKAQTTETMDKIVVDEVPFTVILGVILLSGLIMLVATYAFFIAGVSFLGRLVELWILIIFSPFAFISSIVPILSGIETIGWKEWFHRLIRASFMAPIFMFFMYLIFKLVHANIFDGLIQNQKGIMADILLILIPAMIIMAMLLKATEYAKKGSGKFGEMALKGIQAAGGLAIGGAALGRAAPFLI